jgi:carboxylesterase
LSSEKISSAGPFYYHGNKLGILLLHGGGGGTAVDLKPIAEDLYKKSGFTTKVPLLPGFGTSPTILRKIQISDWLNAVLVEFESLKDTCEQVIVGGHSMGGVLAFLLASETNVDGLFSISTPIAIKGFLPKLVPILNLFIKYHSIDSDKLREETNYEWIGYDEIPLNIVPKIRKLMKTMKNRLSKIKCPIILFQGVLDDQIKKNSMGYIFEHVNSKIKYKIWLENNQHSILKCPDHEIIIRELNEFIIKNIFGTIKNKNVNNIHGINI